MNPQNERKALEEEIRILEDKLKTHKTRLANLDSSPAHVGGSLIDGSVQLSCPDPLSNAESIHALLLLSDSALPLGSFAYSSGLESFLAHRKNDAVRSAPKLAEFQRFLHLSLSSMAFANVPYLLAAYHNSSRLEELDNDLDASTPCTVARRASVAQGRALLGVWERSFRASWCGDSLDQGVEHDAARSLRNFSRAMQINGAAIPTTTQTNGHFAPIWGVTSRAMGLEPYQATYIFLINHAKAVLSAAVRASVMGPYQAQNLLAGKGIQQVVGDCITRAWKLSPDDAGQVVPSMDLWIGRHELLYSRIFNS